MGFHGFHAATEFAPQLVHIAHIVNCFITVGMQSESKELEASFITVGMQSESKELEASLAITELVKIAYQNRISFLKSQSQ